MNPLDSLIAAAAQNHQLPVALVKAIVQVESAGNTWAIRYEPRFYDKYVAPQPVRGQPPCTSQTEARLLACSFGLMQIMGATARAVGFKGVFLTELCRPELGLDYGCRYLTKLIRLHQGLHGYPGVVAAYNAGSPRKTSSGAWANQAYVDKIHNAGGFDA